MDARKFEAKDFYLTTPLKFMVYSPSGLGKSSLVCDLLRSFTKWTTQATPPAILYCYYSQPPALDQFPASSKVRFHKGLPKLDAVLQFNRHPHQALVLVYDDLLSEITSLNSTDTEEQVALCVDLCRKQNISLIVTLQEVFPNSSLARLFVRNATHLALFDFKTDAASVARFLKRLFPHDAKEKLKALHFSARLSKGHGYLFIDCSPSANPMLRSRNFIGLPLSTSFSPPSIYVFPDSE